MQAAGAGQGAAKRQRISADRQVVGAHADRPKGGDPRALQAHGGDGGEAVQQPDLAGGLATERQRRIAGTQLGDGGAVERQRAAGRAGAAKDQITTRGQRAERQRAGGADVGAE